MTAEPDLIDVARCRAETPGAERVLHFNNAGAGLMPLPVLNVVKEHLDLEAGIGGYEAADRRRKGIERTYDAIAACLNCSRDDVAVMENATAAWNQAFFAVADRMKPGDRILTAEAEYASNYLTYLKVAADRGVTVEVVPSDADGALDVAALERMMDDRVALVAVTHVPTNGGLVNPAAEIGRITRAAGVPYLLDACQSAGQRVLDVQEIGCDFLTATGRKYLRGPRGTGFLYVRPEALARFEPPVVDLHSAAWAAADRLEWRNDARRFENWEFYEAGRIGLGVAVDYMMQVGMAAIEARVVRLADALRAQLSEVPGVTVHDIGRQKCGITTFAMADHHPAGVKLALSMQGMNVSTSTEYSTRIDMERRNLSGLVRASIHYYNTEEEIDRFVAAVSKLGR
ncbi:MAG: aminotransferase class V-fold PLP-dependent enzyme [Minwuia sp.]|nr:aminotransferase class V-fold PLP-dependent enzyme [Minwuia sp.]